MFGKYDYEDNYKKVFLPNVNKTITDLFLDPKDDALYFALNDGTTMRLADEERSCCESRYMTLDGTDLSYYIGAKLLDADVKSAPNQENEYGDVHEVQFLHIYTSKGVFTLSSHNEHNGYYGGFAIRATLTA